MIQPSPTAPEGKVVIKDTFLSTDFSPADAILCRNTAPLIALAFGLISRDIGCNVLGRDIGTNLLNIIKRAKAFDLTELATNLNKLRSAEYKKAMLRNNMAAAAAVDDKYDCLNIFISAAETIDDIVSKINSLFVENSTGCITLATVHKAKGLEWHRVFILDRHLMPSKWATLPWQQQQERNIQYVAITRAKEELIFINSEGWMD